ncbi:microcin C ABC transporter permease YejB [Pseudodesulfovibrio sp. F-1]|uniref:Microcin C ABC transporter permease YejB n=1 Tax=Pseudodesulfovibrio alkaliphilus TaxID=2661613 RepID=A0A7K1KKY4_9BACT|nr:microcin C ABC transporter permease YejB [Pseudodesulfovibrio alkaliphilus]MUM76738.1 microcin C ABC transporter permease YejB [Pseudodesulfovibrio alkaliphilus]
MLTYLAKRFLFLVPTLLGILAVNFFVVQFAPGGPVEQTIAQMTGANRSVLERVSGAAPDEMRSADTSVSQSIYKGADGLDPALIRQIEEYYGFDRPAGERFLLMLKNYATMNLGESFFRDSTVTDLILEKMPVSISLGLWSTLIIYLVSIPLGIAKAVRSGSRFDVWTTTAVITGNAIPTFLFAVVLIIFTAGGRYLQWFPLRGLTSPNFDDLSLAGQILDYFWHMILPVTSMLLGGFAGLTLLTKNCFLDEIGKLYVMTARAKGLTEKRVLYGHVFRNAMLLVISGLPAAFIGIFFTGSLLVEVIFSLDGLGLMGFEAAMERDYPVMFATLYISSLIGLVMKVVCDITYMFVDPRINFNSFDS